MLSLFLQEQLGARAEVMRRLHSAWLTRALRARNRRSLPRIPTRPVSQGGFAAEMATPDGRAWAGAFWARTLDRPELL